MLALLPATADAGAAMTEPSPEPNLPPRVYWAVALVAVVLYVLLGWFTAAWNIPMEAR